MDILGTAAFTVVSACVGWGGAVWRARATKIEKDHEKADRLEIHRDDLTFELLQSAREEVNGARIEMGSLREEIKTLRGLEQHFFFCQQALDHLEAILYGPPAARHLAERNAKAFVKRMRRLNDAKGTIANEAQRATSTVRVAEDRIEKGK